ncbi:Protein CBG02191 [Caenorhabditis briggsae]|uniref:Protein CBG02191 n=1 Tax=Caenorhabditis briggsae TaxID=6238 RepID=A8WS52_CAEBR|nr:Protein CBG02191 [Caenorhabditis briggsae]CAP23310.1 Protein CBG02191 [Caenorhabditis briggsae]
MEAPEFLKSNDHHLKFCILYEVALKKPIYDSYQTFCEAVGKDAMRYPDFEFWYHRFRLGKLDFDYDRSMDPAPKALIDMPVKVMRKITENLNPFEQCYLRSMNHVMKNFTDSFPTVFESICVEANDDLLRWQLNGNDFECKEVDDGCTFTKPKCLNTKKSDETITQKYNNRVMKTYKECYIKKSLEYLTPLFEIAKLQTNLLWLEMKIQTPELDGLLPVGFNAKRAYIAAYNSDNAVQLLSTLKAGYLESFKIDFNGPMEREHFTIVFETDQFKQAQTIEIRNDVGFNLEDLVNFEHLKQFICGVKSIVEPEEILQIRDTVSTFKNLEYCRIWCSRNGRQIRTLAEVLKEEVPEGLEPLKLFTHRYKNPAFNKTFEFKISDRGIYIRIDILKVQ